MVQNYNCFKGDYYVHVSSFVFIHAGHQCETDIDECASDPCPQDSPCLDQVNGYYCLCTDDLCSGLVTCSSNPCMNLGVCTDTLNGYLCVCPDDYTGSRCETKIDDCADNDCSLFSTCVDGIGSYSCICNNGYQGTLCDDDVDECTEYSNVCPPGFDCQNSYGSYACVPSMTTPGYKGACYAETCYNGGTCEISHFSSHSEYV